MLKILSTDTIIQKCAKQAAMICEYSISNPLHCAFEDGNMYEGITMVSERVWNEKYECYRLFRKKWQYLQRKESKKRDCSVWRQYLSDDGNIYVRPLGRDPYVVF